MTAPLRPFDCGPASPGHSLGGEAAGIGRIIQPPWTTKLSESVDYYAADFEMVLPGIAGQSVESDDLSFELPDGMIGYQQNMTLYILTPTAAVKAKWNLLINGGPVPGFSELLNPPVAANVMYLSYSDMGIKLGNGVKVSVRITDLAGVAATVGGSIGGWYHSERAEQIAWGIRG